MRELNLQKDEMIFECPACGTVVAYTDEDTTIEETYGGDKVKCIQCHHCGRLEQLSFLVGVKNRLKKEGFEIPDEITDYWPALHKE